MSRDGSAKATASRRASAGPPYPRPEVLTAHDLGKGRLEPGIPDGRIQKVLHIDVTGAPTNLLGRLLVGSYITGQDQVLVTARNGLSDAQRQEIHRVVNRTLGMSVVGDTPTAVEVQNFVDPGKHELPRLLHRVVQMLRAELAVCRAALVEKEAPQLQVIENIEEEIDRFYLLMVRQLLLSSDNPKIARSIDVESHHYQIGDRLVAKMLEVIGDLVEGIGNELEENLPGLRRMPLPVVHALAMRVERFDKLLTRTMDAFGHLSVVEANGALNVINELLPNEARLGQEIWRRVPSRKTAVAAQRIAYNLDMALEMLIIVNEVTINRGVEPEAATPPECRVHAGARGSVSSGKVAHSEITILSAAPATSATSEAA